MISSDYALLAAATVDAQREQERTRTDDAIMPPPDGPNNSPVMSD